MKILAFLKSLLPKGHDCKDGTKCEYTEQDSNACLLRKYERMFKPELPELPPPNCVHCGRPYSEKNLTKAI